MFHFIVASIINNSCWWLFIILAVAYYLHYYINCAVVYPTTRKCMVGKVALVTGGNRGIGYETVLMLAERGCKVIVGCRNDQEAVKKKIIDRTNNPNIVVKKLDLMSFDSVRQFAQEIIATEPKLDILINSAGVGGIPFTYTKDGLNPLMQTNHFSPFLLTHLLADLLKKSKPSRVIFVSSFLANYTNLSVENLNYPDESNLNVWQGLKVYGNSKLANIISTDKLAEKFKTHGVTVNAVHPGIVSTEIFTQLAEYGKSEFFIKIVYKVYFTILLNKAPHEGAYAIIEAAVSEKYNDVTGAFLIDKGHLFKPFKLRNKEFCKEIYKQSEELCKLKEHEKL